MCFLLLIICGGHFELGWFQKLKIWRYRLNCSFLRFVLKSFLWFIKYFDNRQIWLHLRKETLHQPKVIFLHVWADHDLTSKAILWCSLFESSLPLLFCSFVTVWALPQRLHPRLPLHMLGGQHCLTNKLCNNSNSGHSACARFVKHTVQTWAHSFSEQYTLVCKSEQRYNRSRKK